VYAKIQNALFIVIKEKHISIIAIRAITF